MTKADERIKRAREAWDRTRSPLWNGSVALFDASQCLREAAHDLFAAADERDALREERDEYSRQLIVMQEDVANVAQCCRDMEEERDALRKRVAELERQGRRQYRSTRVADEIHVTLESGRNSKLRDTLQAGLSANGLDSGPQARAAIHVSRSAGELCRGRTPAPSPFTNSPEELLAWWDNYEGYIDDDIKELIAALRAALLQKR